jgi:hypothetical protein
MKLVPIACAVAVTGVTIWRSTRLGWPLRICGAALCAALVLYGAGIIRLPQLETMVGTIGSTLGPYTFALVAVMAFLETAAFAGLVVPGETIVIVGGVIAGQGHVDVFALFALTWFCARSGDTTDYLLGRQAGRRFLLAHGPRVHPTEDRVRRTGVGRGAIRSGRIAPPAAPLHRARGTRHGPVERSLCVPGLPLRAVGRPDDRHCEAQHICPRTHCRSHRLGDRCLSVCT